MNLNQKTDYSVNAFNVPCSLMQKACDKKILELQKDLAYSILVFRDEIKDLAASGKFLFKTIVRSAAYKLVAIFEWHAHMAAEFRQYFGVGIGKYNITTPPEEKIYELVYEMAYQPYLN